MRATAIYRRHQSVSSILSKVASSFSSSHTIDIESEHNLIQRKTEFEKYYRVKHDEKLPGFATMEGTQKYLNFKKDLIDASNFATPYKSDLTLTSIGFGSYHGKPDETDDLKMFNGLIDSVSSGGINVVDTALNFRYQKSERTIGAALRLLQNEKNITRDALFLASKGGFLAEDADQGIPSSVFVEQLINDKKITADDIVGTCHSMHPEFLEASLNASLNNLGIDTLDLYYLQNASEVQMPVLGEERFFEKLAKVFEFFEAKIQQGKIKNYGLATWIACRAKQDETNIHLNLQKVVKLAEKVGGKAHGFKYLQVPINVMMPEAFSERWQNIESENGEVLETFLVRAARDLEVNIMASSPLMAGSMINCPLPSDVFKCANAGAKHLQFVRSIPSKSIITTLVGQKANRHVKKNLEVTLTPKLTEEEFWEFLIPSKREQDQEEVVSTQG